MDDAYPDNGEKAANTDELGPLGRSQIRQGELIMNLGMAIDRLSQKLRPVLSEEFAKIEDSNALSIGGVDEPDDKPTIGTSQTISMIDQQCARLEFLSGKVSKLVRYLEV